MVSLTKQARRAVDPVGPSLRSSVLPRPPITGPSLCTPRPALFALRHELCVLCHTYRTSRPYDEIGDILEIFFDENEPATGIELTDHILPRLNQTTGRVVSLTLLHFSVLTEKTEYGPRSYPINRLEEFPEEIGAMSLAPTHVLPTPGLRKV